MVTRTGTHFVPRRAPVLRGTTNRALAARVAQLEKEEKKYVLLTHQAVTVASPSAGATMPCLNAMPRGLTVQNRIGDKVLLGKGKMRGIAYAFGTTNNVMRCGVLMDKQSQNLLPSYNNIVGSAVPSPDLDWNYNNLDFWKRYELLAETVITFETPNAVYSGSTPAQPNAPAKYFELNWDCRRFPANYSGGNAGTYADIEAGCVVFYAIADGPVGNCYITSCQYFTDD